MIQVNFDKQTGLIPAIIQDSETQKVLMLGYMNAESLAKTQSENRVTFFSRSRNRLWTKGETSSNFLIVKEIKADCDSDTLLIQVHPQGPVCHTGTDTCFEEKNTGKAHFLNDLQQIIRQRKEDIHAEKESYVRKLFAKGLNKMAQKVGEEAVELVIEAKDDNAALFKNEAADLLFHFLILLEAKNTDLDEIITVLQERQK
jgi:phosphoribosyl-AMP cyclohydrolase / phosphoribosyl-ATP pyrophosphohydrolase